MKGMDKKDVQVSNPSTGGCSAGVQDGLSHVQSIGTVEDNQLTKGPDQRPVRPSGSAGSKGGKSFKWG